MRRFLHVLLAAFLALAVPLQGLAGATMASCSGAHASAMDHGSGHRHDAHAGHDHDAHAGHDHDAHAGHESHGSAHEPTEGHNCAACAACCSLSVIPVPAGAAATAERPTSHPIPFFGSAHASVQSRGLERPPSPTFLG